MSIAVRNGRFSVCLLAAASAVVAFTMQAGALRPALGAEDESAARAKGMLHVYFGTYTGGKSEGIYVGRLNLTDGSIGEIKLAAQAENPSFVELHPTGEFLYAVGELSELAGKKGTGGVTAFRRDAKTGLLERLNEQPSQGAGPCHLAVDAAGNNVLAANYGGGSVVVVPIGEGGRLREPTSFIQHEGSSVNPARQQGPHAHSVNLDAANRFAFVADLGLDKVLIYRFDGAAGNISANDPPFAAIEAGGGPRHFAWHPGGRFAYVNSEMTSRVTAMTYDAEKGRLAALQTLSTLPEDFDGKNNSTAEVRVHPSGKFVYVSNRGHDSVAIFAVDEKTGRLTAAGHASTGGKTPRNFNIEPSGKYLVAANQASDSVVVFRINGETGGLTEVSRVEVPAPVCVRFAALGD